MVKMFRCILSILSEVAKFVLPILIMLEFVVEPIKTIFEQILQNIKKGGVSLQNI